MALQRGPCQYSSANGLSHTHWQAKSSAQTQSPRGMRRIKPLHLFWKRIALFNMFIKNIHVSLCSINLCLENGPGKKCIWKRICQIHQIRWIKYKYKYMYMAWNLIKYKYKYAVFVFVFVFANTNTYLTPALDSSPFVKLYSSTSANNTILAGVQSIFIQKLLPRQPSYILGSDLYCEAPHAIWESNMTE